MTGKKVTGRTKQLSLKATPEFHQRLKVLAVEEKCLMIEILEQAIELYEQVRKEKEWKQAIKEATLQVSQAEMPEKRVDKRPIQEIENDTKKRKVEDSTEESDGMEID